MSAVRHNSPSVRLRLRGLYNLHRSPGYVAPPDRECAGTDLGARLAIAALYGGQGDTGAAHASALLACAGVSDTPDNRAAVLTDLDAIFARVRVVVTGGPSA